MEEYVNISELKHEDICKDYRNEEEIAAAFGWTQETTERRKAISYFTAKLTCGSDDFGKGKDYSVLNMIKELCDRKDIPESEKLWIAAFSLQHANKSKMATDMLAHLTSRSPF